jgi:hypothetical protein
MVMLKKIFYIFILKLKGMFTTIKNIKENFFVFLFLLLIIIFIYLLYTFYKNKFHKKEPSFKKLISFLPIKICYWRYNGSDYFIHEEIPILLKTSLGGYSLIQFVLTYNQDIINEFNKLQEGIIEKANVLISNLNINIHITKYEDYFFMILNKVDYHNESILIASLNNISNLIWLEVNNSIIYTNNASKKYPNILTTIQNNIEKNIILFDHNMYKYHHNKNSSCTLHILSEINEFKNFHEQEQSNNVLYEALGFLKEKFVILSRDSRVLFISNGLKKLVNIENNVYTLGDILDVMRSNNFLPEEMNFKNYVQNLKNNIYFCKEVETEYFGSLDGRIFSRVIIPFNNNVMIIFEDVSQQITNKKQLIQSKSLQDFYWNNMDEGILIFDSNGYLLFNNPIVKEFVNENYISSKEKFIKNLKLKDEELNLYISTSIYNNENFIIVNNHTDDMEIYILKPYKEYKKNNDITDFYYKILREIDVQWRYLDYLSANELNAKKIEQFNFVYKSVYKLKIYTYSNIDYYESLKITNEKAINIVSFLKNYVTSINNLYNLKNLNIEYETSEFLLTLDLNILQRCFMYLIEFFYGFFLMQNKMLKITIANNIININLYVEEKFDFNNFNITRLLFVLQKLFKFIKFQVKFNEDNKGFSIFIHYVPETES